VVSQTQLFKVGGFNFRLNHLLVIGILVLAFSISFLIRVQGMDYGFELNEFDPFFNFRATEFIVENGPFEYFKWHDDMSWHPEGRDVSATSQVMLHITAAITYQIFGGDMSLYDFTILFPAIIGSLTVVVIFALVRVLGGTTAGLFAALLFSVSLPIIIRGTLGWFKSEPLGLFFGILGVYFFLSGIKTKDKKIAISKAITGGIILSFGLASWGGIQFFVIPLGLFVLALPFVRKDFKFVILIVPTFVFSFLLTTMMFERPGAGFVFGIGGFSLIIPTLFLIACIFVQKISKLENQNRNGLLLLLAMLIISSSLIVVNAESEFLPLPTFRYLNAINPFLTTDNPLVDSVAEHATTTTQHSFLFHSVLMIFAGLGIWIMFNSKFMKNKAMIKNEMIVFSLCLGIVGVYVSSAFVRLEIFASISLIVLASIGLSIITSEFINNKKIENSKISPKFTKISYLIVVVILLSIPLMIPENGNWINTATLPATILNGGTGYIVSTDDWKNSLEWMKLNTPPDSVIAAWWDYGYWITTMSDRKTLADNATLDSLQIKKIAKMFVSSPDGAWRILNEMDSDYVLVFVAASKLNITDERPLYLLSGGGDESKKQWFMKIAGEPVGKYLHSDGISGTDYFWNDTILGKMIPFSLVGYVNPNDNSQQSFEYFHGSTGIYKKDIKYPIDGDGPLRLVYSSPSYVEENNGAMIGIFVYEINKEYVIPPVDSKQE
jgi:dolichyl-diphosphooligosaccharide--protein glycosyltransferase